MEEIIKTIDRKLRNLTRDELMRVLEYILLLMRMRD